MSSQENEARKQLRTGIRGEYEMRPLDQFTVTEERHLSPAEAARVREMAAESRQFTMDAMFVPTVAGLIELMDRIPPLPKADIAWPKD